eukprot:scaffold78647_cov63-Phaeocystis_antarctica.AAC.2
MADVLVRLRGERFVLQSLSQARLACIGTHTTIRPLCTTAALRASPLIALLQRVVEGPRAPELDPGLRAILAEGGLGNHRHAVGLDPPAVGLDPPAARGLLLGRARLDRHTGTNEHLALPAVGDGGADAIERLDHRAPLYVDLLRRYLGLGLGLGLVLVLRRLTKRGGVRVQVALVIAEESVVRLRQRLRDLETEDR